MVVIVCFHAADMIGTDMESGAMVRVGSDVFVVVVVGTGGTVRFLCG